jgi:altronate dehydratase large subunit
MGFMGYKRPDGGVGVRNHVLVMSSVCCANGVVNAIGKAVPEVKTITHTEGCGRGIQDIGITLRTVIGLCQNPNVAAVLVVGLGCEVIKAPGLADEIKLSGKPVESLVVQDEGGSKRATAKAIEIVKEILADANKIEREECGWDKLLIGLECGASDALSGVTANPLVGFASDWLVGKGGSVILSETTEMTGTEQILSKRAATPELGEKVVNLIKDQTKYVKESLGPMAAMVISPGNIEGGISNISEKSLGCIIKGGTTQIMEILDYAVKPSQKGLVIMDTPGSDIFSLTGKAAGGCQIMLFTTGRGTPAGFPIVPVIKISSNSDTYRKLEDDIDLNAGRLLEGVNMDEVGGELVELIKEVANGKEPKAEQNMQDCLSIMTVSKPF